MIKIFLLTIASTLLCSVAFSSPVDHHHGNKAHSHNLPAEGMAHRHGSLPFATQYRNSVATPQKKSRILPKKSGLEYFNLAKVYIRKNQYKKSEPLLTKSCNLNYVDSCNYLGMLYSHNLQVHKNSGVQKNERKSTRLYIKTCNLNSPVGCFRYGYYQQKGIGGLTMNKTKSEDLYLKA